MMSFLMVVTASGTAFSQKVYPVEYESQADLKIYIVDYESQADLNVYTVQYESQADEWVVVFRRL